MSLPTTQTNNPIVQQNSPATQPKLPQNLQKFPQSIQPIPQQTIKSQQSQPQLQQQQLLAPETISAATTTNPVAPEAVDNDICMSKPTKHQNSLAEPPAAPAVPEQPVKIKNYHETVLEENYDHLLEEYNRQRRENELLKAQMSKMKHNFNSMYTDLNKRQDELKKRLEDVKVFHSKAQENNSELRNQLWNMTKDPSLQIMKPTAFRPVALPPSSSSSSQDASNQPTIQSSPSSETTSVTAAFPLHLSTTTTPTDSLNQKVAP